MTKQFVTVLLPGDADTATLFDGFPSEALYTRETLDDETLMDSEAMDKIGLIAGRATYRAVQKQKNEAR